MNTEQNNGLSMKDAASPRPNLGLLFKANERINAVKLPEWEGFWFKLESEGGSKALVFTKEDQLIDTPDYEQYGEREDWEHVKFDAILGARFVKYLRRRTFTLQNKLDTLYNTRSRELALASTSLQLAFMWMGKMLGEIGEANPYPESKDPNSKVIATPTDRSVNEELFVAFGDLDEVAITKGLRKELSLVQNIFRELMYWDVPSRSKQAAYPAAMAIDKGLSETVMWLGEQLNAIHIAAENKKEKEANQKN